MSAYSEHESSAIQLMDDMGDDCPVIVWGGTTIKVLPSTVALRGKNSPGGIALESDFQCTALASSFSSQPKANQLITYLTKSLRIAEVRIIAGGKLYRILANDAAQSL